MGCPPEITPCCTAREGGESTPLTAAGQKLSFCGRFFFTLPHRRIILSPACSFPSSRSRPSGYSNTEDAMKVCTTLLSLALAGAVFAAMPAGANQAAAEDKKAPAAKKETKWQGHVVRINKDETQMDIRDSKTTMAGHLKKVAYDSSTE